MVVEAVQTYVNLVNGVSRATRERARAAARGLLAQAGLEEVVDDAEKRVTKLTDEILGASRANRELLENLVAAEVTKVASRLGFVRSEDLDEVREEIAELRAQLARDKAATTGAPRARNATARKAAAAAAPEPTTPRPAAKKTAAAKKAATAKKTATATKAATTAGDAAGAPAARRAPGPGRATSTRPGAAQRLAEEAGTPTGVPDPDADAGA
ncbi:polyhydroxyalkanoate synthesis protein PhaF [Microlunatus capsulatus]|uniref:Polyhydroxyalkanoate synthesis regulator phasin n=1 Tax=Microlunatus capsulatus TaxID=99117 RepID=A0ABS4ZCI0_9ACTN|nr:polyhydroxyalkanoate synthesis protein PhaF [Microlunatus capsulatus]MBP2418747.1 polyhydroxyalkanoate synthesis regulator phasin [Microlunatus capsulatus]